MKSQAWAVALCNVLICLIFAGVACYFGKWWIMLIGPFSMMKYNSNGGIDESQKEKKEGDDKE